MKNKKKSFINMPGEVMAIMCNKYYGIPIGISLFNETVKKYPEWFPEEYARITKWESIPKDVHEAYIKEICEFREQLWENEPKLGGIFSAMNNDNYQKWQEAYDRLYPIEQSKKEELHIKYYSKYGL